MSLSPKTKGYLKGIFVGVMGGCILSLAAIGTDTVLSPVLDNHSLQHPAVAVPPAPTDASADAPMDENTAKIFKMLDIMGQIARTHVDEEKATDLGKMITSGLKGMLMELDPHSDYLTPDEFKTMMEGSSGEFSGIGMSLTTDTKTRFIRAMDIMENSPAERAGLKAGDIVTKIGEISTNSISLEDAVKLVRGIPGTPVTLTVLHQGDQEAVPVTLTRAKVENLPVKASKIGNIGYIRLSDFMYEKVGKNGKVTQGSDGKAVVNGATLVRDAILKMKAEIGSNKVQGYVLDLRFNPGGQIYQAVDIADHFLDAGKPVVTSRGRAPGASETHNTQIAGDITDGKPVVVLVNEGSASASELLTGALQDYGRVTVVGHKTFGKGSVQQIFPLDNGDALKVTIARYYTPQGHAIQNLGVTPDILYTGKTPLDGQEIRTESGMKNTLADKANDNPHQTRATCGPVSEDMAPDALAKDFGKAVIGMDGKVDGMLLCAVETLQGQSKWTITEPYAMPAHAPAALTN